MWIIISIGIEIKNRMEKSNDLVLLNKLRIMKYILIRATLMELTVIKILSFVSVNGSVGNPNYVRIADSVRLPII